LALGKDHQLSVNEFMHVYRIQRNPGSFGVYNFQTKRGKFVQLDSKYSSNWHWKNKYFFVSGQWEFAPKEKVQGPRVPREVNTPADRAFQKPILIHSLFLYQALCKDDVIIFTLMNSLIFLEIKTKKISSKK
jgi:hypothetical protein